MLILPINLIWLIKLVFYAFKDKIVQLKTYFSVKSATVTHEKLT